jgi:hypothetical protein
MRDATQKLKMPGVLLAKAKKIENPVKPVNRGF